jgi:hypothetical protein
MPRRAVPFCVSLIWLGVVVPAAGQETTAAPAPAKVAVVVAGDPDDAIRAPAARLDGLLNAHPEMRNPSDPGLRRALRGEPPTEEDDGLERARAERRRLGWGEGKDLEVLVRMGRMAAADLLLVVRAGDEGPEAVAFDVRAGAFYEGALPLTNLEAEAVHRFALARARAASRGTAQAKPPPPAVPAPTTAGRPAPTDTEPAAQPAAEAVPQDGKEEKPSEKPWIARNWPYLVAGAMLVASIIFMVVRDTDDDPGPPVLRFRLGSDP